MNCDDDERGQVFDHVFKEDDDPAARHPVAWEKDFKIGLQGATQFLLTTARRSVL